MSRSSFGANFVPGFVLTDPIGKGSSGSVFSAIRLNPPENVALKLIEIPPGECGAPEQCFSEIACPAGMLCNNVVPITDVMVFSKPQISTETIGKKRHRGVGGDNSSRQPHSATGNAEKTEERIYIAFTMPQMYCTLRSYIEHAHSGSKNMITPEILRYVTKSILEGVCALNFRHQSHFDLKPENILLDLSGGVRIVDFGLGRTRNSFNREVDPSYWFEGNTMVITPGYRPIECWMAPKYLSMKADIFSVGCIVLEMIFGRIMFYKSETAFEANRDSNTKFANFLWMLFEVLPVPSLDFWVKDGNSYDPTALSKLKETIQRYKSSQSIRVDLGTQYDLTRLKNIASNSINHLLPDEEVKSANMLLYQEASHLGMKPSNVLNLVLRQYGESCLEFVVSCLAYAASNRPSSQECLSMSWITTSPTYYGSSNTRKEFARCVSHMNLSKKKKSSGDHSHLTCPTTIQSINPSSYPGNQQIVNIPHHYDGSNLQFTNIESILSRHL